MEDRWSVADLRIWESLVGPRFAAKCLRSSGLTHCRERIKAAALGAEIEARRSVRPYSPRTRLR